MTTEVTETHTAPVEQRASTLVDSPLRAVLADPEMLRELDVDKLERLARLDMEYRREAARVSYNVAFNLAQEEMPPVYKAATNRHTKSRYAYLEDVVAMLHPIITGHGFSRSVCSRESPVDGLVRFVLELRHVDGHVAEYYMDAPIDDKGLEGKPNKTHMHGLASSYTYCERHLLCKVWGVQLTDDEDGNKPRAQAEYDVKITEEQLRQLYEEGDKVGANMDDYFAFLKLTEPSLTMLADLPQSMFKNAVLGPAAQVDQE